MPTQWLVSDDYFHWSGKVAEPDDERQDFRTADKRIRQDDHPIGFNLPFSDPYPAFLSIWIQSLLPDKRSPIL
jgi:hypothetical protein